MSVKKLSPVAEFLRANHAIAKNHTTYRAYPSGEAVRSCEFYDPNGNYLGKMTRTLPYRGKNPGFAYLRSLIETMEPGYKAGFRQLKENAVYYAKILGLNGKKESYLPEKILKKQVVIDNKGYRTEDTFERTISSKMTLVKAADQKAYGYVPQNTYRAEEPIKYKEVQTGHSTIQSDKF